MGIPPMALRFEHTITVAILSPWVPSVGSITDAS